MIIEDDQPVCSASMRQGSCTAAKGNRGYNQSFLRFRPAPRFVFSSMHIPTDPVVRNRTRNIPTVLFGSISHSENPHGPVRFCGTEPNRTVGRSRTQPCLKHQVDLPSLNAAKALTSTEAFMGKTMSKTKHHHGTGYALSLQAAGVPVA